MRLPISHVVGTLCGCAQELIELKREIKDGMYSPLSYIIANAILQVLDPNDAMSWNEMNGRTLKMVRRFANFESAG
jgi:hypothetical protein